MNPAAPAAHVEAALRSAAAGDPEAFEQVIRSFWEPVMRFFWRRVDRAQAEDLAQQVFASVLRSVRGGGGGPVGGDPAAWRRFLMVSARNCLISHWRRQRVRPPLRSLARLLDDEISVAGPSAPAAAPARGPLADDERAAIRDCLDALEPLARTMCWLIFVEGHSGRQAARILGSPEATVRTGVAGALRRLRACLEGKGVMGP